MRTKTYRGKEMNLVLDKIRADLGETAMILSSREVNNDLFEVSVGLPAAPTNVVSDRNTALIPLAESNRRAADSMLSQKKELQRSLRSILEIQGLSPTLIRQFSDLPLGKSAGRRSLDRLVGDGLAKCCEFSSVVPLKSRTIALIGPTGVGKTTTIAKLAARIKMAFNVSVGLISADSYRIGAGFQLQTYAALMNLPCRVLDPEARFDTELERALESFKKLDVVLIDTPGFSPRDNSALNKLATELEPFNEIEKMLVLAAPSNDSDLSAVVKGFSRIGFDRLVISKLDESGFIGPVVNAAIVTGKPIGFFTTGQRVPEDIEPASSRRLGWMLTRKVH